MTYWGEMLVALRVGSYKIGIDPWSSKMHVDRCSNWQMSSGQVPHALVK